MNKNHEGYADYTAYKAIRRVKQPRNKKQKPVRMKGRLMYRIGEVVALKI